MLRGGATAQVLQGNAGQTRQVPGQQARGFLGIKAVGFDQGFLQVAQLLLQALGEELLVEAGGWGLVGHGVARRGGCRRSTEVGPNYADVMWVQITCGRLAETRVGFMALRGTPHDSIPGKCNFCEKRNTVSESVHTIPRATRAAFKGAEALITRFSLCAFFAHWISMYMSATLSLGVNQLQVLVNFKKLFIGSVVNSLGPTRKARLVCGIHPRQDIELQSVVLLYSNLTN